MSKSKEERTVMADEHIIELYWQRNENAIEETDKKYGAFMFGIAYNILHDRMDSEECRNDTYLGIWNAIPPTRPAAFPAFIMQIVRRKAINRYKEKTAKRRVPSELTVSMEDLDGALHSEMSVENEYTAEEVGKVIGDYVRGLTDRQQYIFMSRYYVSDSVKDIARELAVSHHTVYRELEHIKSGLKEHLERNGVYV